MQNCDSERGFVPRHDAQNRGMNCPSKIENVTAGEQKNEFFCFLHPKPIKRQNLRRIVQEKNSNSSMQSRDAEIQVAKKDISGGKLMESLI
jgi:hypothetical protein